MREYLYGRTGERFSPEAAAMSPWDRRLQGGVALGALLTHLVEETPAPSPMLLTRLTIDIIRPVPFQPLVGRAEIIRDGRNMQNIEARLEHEGALVAAASAVRVRLAETPASPMTGDYPPPEDAPDRPLVRSDRRRGGLETRILSGGLLESGPGQAWGRPAMDLFPGTPVSLTAGAAMVADIGSAVSSEVDSRRWSFANVDLVLHFTRAPESEWVLIDARTLSAGNGVGLVDSILADRRGPFARAHQTLFIAPQPAAPTRPAAAVTEVVR
ncbi:thioesterase family protein [Phenylobacterium zucineum]|nr:thioesterase family protein [Phenylobacterium zucineum]